MENKKTIGAWKEALKRRAESAFINGDRDDYAMIELLAKNQQENLGINTQGGKHG